jgi:hypothetical protein
MCENSLLLKSSDLRALTAVPKSSAVSSYGAGISHPCSVCVEVFAVVPFVPP